MGLKLNKNPNWKGGVTTTSHGYVKIKTPNHPFTDVSGYVYKHRLVMEKHIGRYLKPEEIVHHLNENRSDNRIENLELEASIGFHKLQHRTRTNLRKPDEENLLIECACGCGKMFLKFDNNNRPRKFYEKHNCRKGKKSYDVTEMIFCACGCGTKITKYDKYARIRKFVNGHNARIDNPNVRKR